MVINKLRDTKFYHRSALPLPFHGIFDWLAKKVAQSLALPTAGRYADRWFTKCDIKIVIE